MIEPTQTSDRRVMRIAGIVIGAVLVATVSAAGAVLLARRSGVSFTAPSSGSAVVKPLAVSLRRNIEVRAGPAPDQAIVTRLTAAQSVNVIGRSVDSSWLVISPSSAPDIVGWVPADAVEGVRDIPRLAVIEAGAGVPTPPAGASRPPDLPDLRIEGASSRANRLVAVVVNDGPGDLPTPILIAVNDGAPIRVETKAGELLRAKERVEVTVPGEYVQLRARVALRVVTEPANREAKTDNNAWEGIIEPDRPNNLGIAKAAAAGDDRQLVVTVQNDSPIPVRGTITLTVREALPSTTLLGRDAREVLLDAGKSMDIPFPDLRQVDLTRIAVRLSTDAIHDAVLADDSYPR